MSSWIAKILPPRIARQGADSKKNAVPEGLWKKCDGCDSVLYVTDLDINANVCPKCNHHMRLSARVRLDHLLDVDGREEIAADVLPVDALKFKDSKPYSARLTQAKAQTGETDALVVMSGSMYGLEVVIAAFEFEFMGGSMGSVVGERFCRGVQAAIDQHVPFISIAASGGARMQEGVLSLMQMAKTNTMLSRLAEARLPYVSVLTDPTMGGVSASFAFMGDIVIAEPGALIGFAGPRVIEQTVREKLPEGFQRAEFLLEKGAVDMIVDRRQMKPVIAKLLAQLTNRSDIAA